MSEADGCLPTGWWKDQQVASILSECFGEHLIGLEVHYTAKAQPMYSLYTGFLLEVAGLHFWVTAGHVVNTLKQYLTNAEVANVRGGLVDGYQHPYGATIPVSLQDMPLHGPFGDLDLGIAILREGYVKPLLANPKVRPLNPLAWKGHESSTPDGYYLVGFPSARTALVELSRSEELLLCRGRCQVVCLPVERVSPKDKEQSGAFWNHPGAFYGRLIRREDSSGRPLESVLGMSGGPILSIECAPGRQFRYRLFGVQSAWLEPSGFIRGVPISALADLLAHALEASGDQGQEACQTGTL